MDGRDHIVYFLLSSDQFYISSYHRRLIIALLDDDLTEEERATVSDTRNFLSHEVRQRLRSMLQGKSISDEVVAPLRVRDEVLDTLRHVGPHIVDGRGVVLFVDPRTVSEEDISILEGRFTDISFCPNPVVRSVDEIIH